MKRRVEIIAQGGIASGGIANGIAGDAREAAIARLGCPLCRRFLTGPVAGDRTFSGDRHRHRNGA